MAAALAPCGSSTARAALPGGGLFASLLVHGVVLGAALWFASGAPPEPPAPAATVVAIPVVLVPEPAMPQAAATSSTLADKAPVEPVAVGSLVKPPEPDAGSPAAPDRAPPADGRSMPALPNPAHKPAPPANDRPPDAPASTAEPFTDMPRSSPTLPLSAVAAAAADSAAISQADGGAGATTAPRLDDGVANPPPVYPRRARRLGQEGTVVLRVRVSLDGRAHEVAILTSSGHALLDEAARAAVARWAFTPARHGTADVEGTIEVPVTFRLTD